MRHSSHGSARDSIGHPDVAGSLNSRDSVLRAGYASEAGWGLKLNFYDTSVVAVGAAAVTHDWWMGLASWVPDIAQVCITLGSLIFVTFRAYNEVRKFLDNRRSKQ